MNVGWMSVFPPNQKKKKKCWLMVGVFFPSKSECWLNVGDFFFSFLFFPQTVDVGWMTLSFIYQTMSVGWMLVSFFGPSNVCRLNVVVFFFFFPKQWMLAECRCLFLHKQWMLAQYECHIWPRGTFHWRNSFWWRNWRFYKRSHKKCIFIKLEQPVSYLKLR